MAFEKAKKEGTTDALKRALKNFGNVLGNCVYDRDYIAKVTKVKIPQTKWSVENLHRAPQFAPAPVAPIKKEVVDIARADSVKMNPVSDDTSHTEEDYDEFGVELFDETDFGESYQEVDGIVEDKDVKMGGMNKQVNGRPPPPNAQPSTHIPPRVPPVQQQRGPSGNIVPLQTASNAAPTPAPQTPNRGRTPTPQAQPLQKPQSSTATTQSRPPPIPQAALPSNAIPQSALPSNRSNPPPRQPPHPPPNQTHQPNSPFVGNNPRPNNTNNASSHSSSPGVTSGHFNAQNPSNQPNQPPTDAETSDFNVPPATFFSARAAIDPSTGAQGPANPLQKFNPHADSPSIRKTAGFNHGKSAPIVRATLGMAPPALPPATSTGGSGNGNNNGAIAYVDPARDTNRRVGAPPGFSMPGGGGQGGGAMGTSSFRSPVMKRSADGNPLPGQGPPAHTNAVPTAGNGPRQYQPGNQQNQQYQPPNQSNQNQNSNSNIAARRPPLSDVTNTGVPSPGSGPGAKRVKIEGAGAGNVNSNGNGSFRAGNVQQQQQGPRAQ
jgi:DNA repair and recombination protein RAD52